MVRKIFFEHEANSILAIPLSPSFPHDSRIWAYTSSGRFFVASAYRVALHVISQRKGDCGEGSDPRQIHSFWKFVWQLQVPNKIRSFVWRACRDILPTKSNLMQRHILQENICEACGLEVEDSGHLFWRCSKTQEVWAVSGLVRDLKIGRIGSFMDLLWLLKFQLKLEAESLASVTVIA